MEPSLYILGWNISVVKRILGALAGYCSEKVSVNEYIPPSQAESSGPTIVAFQTYKSSSSTGAALIPSAKQMVR